MLELKNIKKSYTTAGFTQNALDGVSVAFRDNEFAAVLGPSGSGKTTMLNVVGGLDNYDSGDLAIDGISTKNYRADDWDTYRNNRIGFVFQSYNLIPHQNVLSNVELALTLSGVSKSERRRRARKALREVGLSEHARKKPGQLSGGQMQRVAIARALINDPEILLADEPTGALDSTTGLQVMELLTKIAEDRLVIMVTHNNELAEEYANRIVHLKDGKVISDSRPFDPSAEQHRPAGAAKRASMSFFTAISLSLANLMTKKGRTFTTAFAGSIGIIGVGTILAFSNGINEYIRGIEEDTLSVYPLTVQEQAFDLSGFFTGGDDNGDRGEQRRRERPEGTVREMQVMEAAFSTQNLNDLASLKHHIEKNGDLIEPYVTTIQYTYDITPQIYLADTSNGVDRIHPDSMFTDAMGMGEMPSVGGMGPAMMMNVFYELPNEPDLYLSQYEVLAGHWPGSYDEAVLVLQFGNRILDFTLYSLGIRDRAEMRAMLESVMQGSDLDLDISESEIFYPYETLMGVALKVVNPADTYQYDEIYEVWMDKSGDDAYMREVLAKSMDLKIVGIVQPLEDASATVLSAGVNYAPDLIFRLMDEAAKTDIVKQQMEKPEINVISGNTFSYEKDNPPGVFDFSRIISVDEDVFQDAMGLESLMNSFSLENMDFSNMDLSSFDMSGFDFSALAGSMDMAAMSEGMDFSGFDMSSMDFEDMMGDMDFEELMGGMDFGEMMGAMDFGSLDMNSMLGNLDIGAIMTSVPPPDIGGMINYQQLIASILVSGAIDPNITDDIIAVVVTQDFLEEISDALLAQATNIALGTVTYAEVITDAINQYFTDNPDILGYEIPLILQSGINNTLLEEQIALQMGPIISVITQEYMTALMSVMSYEISNAITYAIEQMVVIMTEQIQSAVEQMIETMMKQIQKMIEQMVEMITEQIQTMMEEMMVQMQESMESIMRQISAELSGQMETVMEEISAQIEETIGGMFEDITAQMEGFDSEALSEAFKIELSEETIYELMTAIMNPQTTSYEQNLSLLGYADLDKPVQISFYPLSFEAKDEVLAFLDNYNSEMERTGQSEKVIHYTDIVGLMMSSVTDIVDIVSYALIAFVSVALVVSSIMIGVITFVSVLERKKEIGILRAVGASKGNIRLVFNAETLIIGFVAGVIGVIVTSVIIIIANAILWNLISVRNLVIMPPTVPVLLVCISMFLTFLAGLIPAQAAASKPPVEALRSE